MKKKRTAVVGAGWFGRAHVRNFNELSTLVGVCDTDKDKLELVKQMVEDVNHYSDVGDMIKNEDIDAVSIVTPPKFIPQLAKKCADAGIDILMEKPMALSMEELTSFKDYANKIHDMEIELVEGNEIMKIYK